MNWSTVVGRARSDLRSKGQMTKRTPSFLPYLACGQTRACPEQTGEGRRELLPPGGLFFCPATAGADLLFKREPVLIRGAWRPCNMGAEGQVSSVRSQVIFATIPSFISTSRTFVPWTSSGRLSTSGRRSQSSILVCWKHASGVSAIPIVTNALSTPLRGRVQKRSFRPACGSSCMTSRMPGMSTRTESGP